MWSFRDDFLNHSTHGLDLGNSLITISLDTAGSGTLGLAWLNGNDMRRNDIVGNTNMPPHACPLSHITNTNFHQSLLFTLPDLSDFKLSNISNIILMSVSLERRGLSNVHLLKQSV